jgi:hypothetical protein
MNEKTYIDVFDAEIVLADEVSATILIKHPEVEPFLGKFPAIFRSPAQIRRSVNDERAVLYYYSDDQLLTNKWIVAVVKRIDRNFVSTIYLTDKIKAGEILWKR